MERPILQGCCCNSTFRKGTDVTPNPSSWQSVGDLCQDVLKCFKSNGPNGKRLIVHFFLPGTQIRIDIGNVKAAGVLCVLGISFGIGTYVLYKIYDKFIRPRPRRKPTEGEDEEEDVYCEANPDEDIMGNQQSSLADIPVYYKKGYGVSLYNWSEDKTVCLRNRKNKEQLAIADDVIQENLYNKNGIVGKDHSGQAYGNASEEVDILKGNIGKHRPPSLKELRIDIDESGFVEEKDVGGMKLSSSLVGNFSPTSLHEKNLQFSPKSDSDLEIDAGNQNEVKVKAKVVSGSPKLNNGKLDQLQIDTKLTTSSVLLTPPSEDELSSSQQNHSGPEPHSSHSTKSDVSDIHSEIVEPKLHEQPETDEEREMLSPLPYDRSPHASPERQFKKKLALKLNQISSRGFVSSSNTSSLSSTPDSYFSHRRTDSSGGEKENSISGISSPELDMLHSENSENGMVIEKSFTTIEDEIHVVEDEFEELSKQIGELSKRYSDKPVPGAEIFEDIFQRYPSIRVRQLEKGVQYMPSLSEIHPAGRVSVSSETNDNSVFESEEKSVSESDDKNTSEMESADLSWDMENVLDMVYSEASESGSNPLVERLKVIPEQVEVTSSASASFNSAVDLEGSLYEEDYYLQLGSAVSPRKEESPDIDSKEGNTSSRGDHSTVTQSVCNIGAQQSLSEYADTEWKGVTDRAKIIRKAYREIPKHCQCCHLRQIRGDNYCAVRGVVFQTLVHCLPPLGRWASREAVLNHLSAAYSSPSSGIKHWTFAGRIPHTTDNKLDVMTRCINTFYAKFEQMKAHSSERESLVAQMLNSDPGCDLELMEGVKLLMQLSAIHLFNDIQQGIEVPVFAWLLFARDTSEDLESFVKNHLNPVGDGAGLEQIEMFLLGYSLGIRIQVFRLQHYGQEDFISQYPDECSPDCPTVWLIAEDDRHYNVPVL